MSAANVKTTIAYTVTTYSLYNPSYVALRPSSYSEEAIANVVAESIRDAGLGNPVVTKTETLVTS